MRDRRRSTASPAEDELEMDGDATILVAPSDLPAGTEHLSHRRSAQPELLVDTTWGRPTNNAPVRRGVGAW